MLENHRLKAFIVPAVLAAAVAAGSARDGASAAPATIQRPTLAVQAAGPARLELVAAPTGNKARYRIREQLVRLDLPNDAIGETSEVTGTIALDEKGKVVPGASKFVINTGSLTSDSDRRDGFVRRNVLQTAQYPTVELVPTEIRGLTMPLPTSGTKILELVGTLTVRGVTRPSTWKVSAQFQGGGVTGMASTGFTFTDFQIQQPRVPVVLSVADTIRLEYDFNLVPKR